MVTLDQIRQIAQAIQPKLPKLLPSDIAANLDSQLTALLIPAQPPLIQCLPMSAKFLEGFGAKLAEQ
ncbi:MULTISPECIES: hypothetical protein [unclassified Leptolyngbya]|uniref:hypothetical protein n=1 Tax=unclassified Leptolyngbya TaxID=2650499 RepID=UPI003D31D738